MEKTHKCFPKVHKVVLYFPDQAHDRLCELLLCCHKTLSNSLKFKQGLESHTWLLIDCYNSCHEELDLPSVQSSITEVNTILSIKFLQFQSRPPISLALSNVKLFIELGMPGGFKYSNLIHWKAKTVQAILSFNAWNNDAMNILMHLGINYMCMSILMNSIDRIKTIT